MSELWINIKMSFNYIVDNKADMNNFVSHKNELGQISVYLLR
jgi:hypothetical protein